MRDEQFIESRTSWYRWIAFIVFFVSGFAALLYQVIWQRLLVFFSGADVYSVTLIVTTFMAGLGLGNFGGAGALVLFVMAMPKQPEASPVTVELGEQEPNPSLPQTAESTGFAFGTWLLLYVLSGFIALSLEILWLRLLTIMLKCTAFAFGTMLTIYLGGLGLGAIAGTKFVQRNRRPVSVFLALQTLVAVSAGIAIVLLVSSTAESLIPNLSTYFGVRDPLNVSLALNGILTWWRNQALPLDTSAEIGRFVLFLVVVPLVLILPATTLMGLSFPYLQKAVQHDVHTIGRRVGALQVANILGCMGGASLTGLTLLNQFGPAVTLKIVIGLASIFAALWLRNIFKTRVGSVALALALITIACVSLPL